MIIDMFLWRSKQKYPLIVTKYPPYLFHCVYFRSLGASQLSLEGVTEDESVTDPGEKARQRLRQRAEIALGRKDDESDHTHSDHSSRYRYEDRNGHAGGRYEERNGHAGGRTRGRRYRDDDYSEEERSRKSSTHSSHHNGRYKYSDESNEQHSDHDTDAEEKRKYFEDREEEEDNTRNSFTPVKFKPRLEKELDSIRIKEMNRGAVDYIRRQDDDTPSVDFSDSGRNYLRSMSSFSQPGDSESNAPATRPQIANRYLQNVEDERTPTPPAPLPLNIPAKFKTGSDSDRPSPRPVPAPRPPRSTTPSSRGTENVVGSQDRLNNLSQDESVRGSRDRLDKVDMSRDRFSYKKATGDEPDLNIRSNVDYLPKHDTSDLESGRDSPLHQSHENLLPKQLESTPQYTYQDDYPPMNVKPDNMYRQDMFEPNVNSSKEKLYPTRDNDPGTDYLGREISHQRDLSDSAGVDYLPRQTHTPVDKKYGAGYPSAYNQGPQPSASPGYNTGYRPGHTNDYSPSPSPGYSSKPSGKFHPSQFSGFGNHGNYPAGMNIDSDYSAGEAGIDYLPKAGNQYRNPAPAYPSATRDNISRSRENLSRSREDISRSRENLSRSRENLSRSRENLSRSKENLSRSTYDSEILENSSDFNKPKQYKSIETEI